MQLTSSLPAVLRTARSMAWGPLAGTAVAVACLVAAQRPWDGRTMTLGVARVAVALAALGAAFALDDAAATTLASSPTSLRWRRGVRLGLAAVVAGSVVVVAVVTAGAFAGTAGLPLRRLAVEGSALVLLAMVLSVAFGSDCGAFAFAAGLLAAVVVQQRWPSWSLFPMAPGSPGWSGSGVAWGAVAVVSAGGLGLLTRDPFAARPRGLGTRPQRWPPCPPLGEAPRSRRRAPVDGGADTPAGNSFATWGPRIPPVDTADLGIGAAHG